MNVLTLVVDKYIIEFFGEIRAIFWEWVLSNCHETISGA